jgi:lambda family phage tail tape measure protein
MAVIQDFIVRIKTQGGDALRGLKGDIADLASGINPLSNSLPGLARGLGLVGGVVGVAAGAFALAGMKAIQLADQISDLADATNISAGTLLNFKNSVIAAGGGADDFQKLASKLNQSVQEAAGGNEQLQKSFQTLGVYVRDAEGNIRSTDDILGELTTNFQQGRLSGAQYAAAVDLLGKSFTKLDPSKLTAVKDPVADADIKRLADYQTSIDAIRARLEKGLISFFGSVAEQAEGAFSRIDKAQKRFAEEQKKLAQQGLTQDFVMGQVVTRPMNKREQEAAKREQALNELRNAPQAGYLSGGLAGSRKAKSGDFGATPESVLKAREASEKRMQESLASIGSEQQKKSLNEEIQLIRRNELIKLSLAGENLDKVSQLRAAAEQKTFSNYVRQLEQEKEIQINLKRDIEKAAAEIKTREKLNDAEKAKELSVVEKELKLKAENDIQKIRNSGELLAYETRIQLEKDLTAFRIDNEKKIADITQSGLETQVDEYRQLTAQQTDAKRQIDDSLKAIREQNIELQNRLDIQQSINDLGDVDKKRISEISDAVRVYRAELEKIQTNPMLGDEETNSRVEELNKLLEQRVEIINRTAEIETERQNSFGAGVQDQIRQYKESITAFKIGGQMVDSVYGNMMSALERFVKQGKFSFKDFANSVILDLVMIEARANATRLFTSLFSFGGSSVPGRALGGPVLPNQPYIVGEKGPEVFLPNAAGNIIPNNKLGSGGAFGGGASVTYNINAVDAPSFRQMIAKDPSFLYAVTEQGRKSIPSTRR